MVIDSELIEKGYHVGTCKIHGETLFKRGTCVECRKMHVGLYRIFKRNGKYYHNRNKTPLPKGFFMEPFYKQLTHPTRRYQMQFVGRVTSGPGTYGIFVRNSKSKDGIGKCLYVGQSVDVARRCQEHYLRIKVATKHIEKLKSVGSKFYKRGNSLKNWKEIVSECVVQRFYYDIADKYCVGLKGDKLANLKIVKLSYIDKKTWSKFTKDEALECLTYLEQLGMDAFQPECNVIAARVSVF